MYETEDQGDGYKALKLYLQKVNPNCTAFFQYPRKNSTAEYAVWYEARPLGIHSLAKMMKDISVEARLSKVYTNHCVTATAITLWSNSGISNRHIMAISGHRSEQSLVSYNSDSSFDFTTPQLQPSLVESLFSFHQKPQPVIRSFSAIIVVPDQTSGNEIALRLLQYSKRANCFQRFFLRNSVHF